MREILVEELTSLLSNLRRSNSIIQRYRKKNQVSGLIISIEKKLKDRYLYRHALLRRILEEGKVRKSIKPIVNQSKISNSIMHERGTNLARFVPRTREQEQ